jgi:hypothetical protein
MKKIINLKKFDTESGERIATWSNGGHSGDFRHCTESLYRTRNGTWFLHGEGGPLSKYARTAEAGRLTTDGEDITSLSDDQAAAWLAEHDIAACERHFPHLIQDA